MGVTRFKMLGIFFDTDLTKMLTLNFSERISNMKAKIKLEFVFYVKTDVSPFLRACPKYASKSYSSCASHILSFCFISVPSFIEISLTVFKL